MARSGTVFGGAALYGKGVWLPEVTGVTTLVGLGAVCSDGAVLAPTRPVVEPETMAVVA